MYSVLLPFYSHGGWESLLSSRLTRQGGRMEESMNWTELLRGEMDYNFKVAENLIALVDEGSLDWKPSARKNWMTVGQLLHHIAASTGSTFRSFITGDWGMPEGVDPNEMSEDEMLPPAEKLPAVKDLAEAKKLLADDRKLAFEMLEKAGEDGLANRPAPAPWDPREIKLGLRLLGMVGHLTQHKGQLFYYLKLQGKPVGTQELWMM